jgi:3-hydroxybutyryl-CoA dehydratase
LSIGVRSIEREIGQQRINAYADASGDHNPIHIDPIFATATPFEGTIAHGMLVLALIEEMMQSALGDAWQQSGTLKVRFKAPTRPGDVVTAAATASSDSEGIAEYAVQCENQRGEVLIEGRARVKVPS